MADTQIAIRRRIKSVNNTLQITRAMELVATSKLQKERNRMLKDKVYADVLYDTMSKALSEFKEFSDEVSPYLQTKNFNKSLTIVYGADEGMCGAFNSNLEKFLEENLEEDAMFIACGNKVIQYANRVKRNPVLSYPDFQHATDATAREIGQYVLDLFLNNEISEIYVIYSEYVNAAVFRPTKVKLLPLDTSEIEDTRDEEILFEPSPMEILEELIPMYIKNVLYSYMLRSRTSEQASRRLAMETASDNAIELKEELTLEYNKARQAAITQEITEISVSGMARD